MRSPTHDAALMYAEHGWHVLPVWWPKADGTCACGDPGCQNIGKHPITTRGQHDATTDAKQIDAWFAQHPSANIGGAMYPSNLIAFDIDKPEAYAAWDEIEKKYGELNTTVQVSGSGCHHVLFKRPPFAIRGTYEKRITLRGNNFIVLAPSLHKSGGRYLWQEGRAPWQVPPAQMPAALAEALKRPEQSPNAINHDYPPAGPEVMRMAQEALMRHGPEVKGVSPPGHTRTAWGILVNDYALAPQEAAPLIRAYNATCSPPWPEDKLFSSPCRAVQHWNNPKGVQRDRIYAQQELAEAGYSPAQVALGQRSRAQRIQDVARTKEPPARFYPTGIDEFDTLAGGGVATRRVVGVVAPPSVGKSAFVTQLCINMQKQLPVLHFSSELPRKECQIRYTSPIVGYPWRDGLKGLIPDDVLQRASEPLKVWIIGSDDYDRVDPIGSLRAEALAIRDQTGTAPLIVVDYVQLLARGTNDQVRHKVGELTMALRTLSQELDCPVIAVFSCSRTYYGNTKEMERLRGLNDPSAFLAAAKESGEIEYDCGTIIFLDVDKLGEGQPKAVRGAVARCRDGEIGFFGLRANLANGQWVGDPSAVTTFANEERRAKRDADDLEDACKRLIEAVRTMPNRPWKEMQAKVSSMGPGGYKLADRARDKLIVDGVIERTVRFDENRRPGKGFTLSFRDVVPPAPEGEPDAD